MPFEPFPPLALAAVIDKFEARTDAYSEAEIFDAVTLVMRTACSSSVRSSPSLQAERLAFAFAEAGRRQRRSPEDWAAYMAPMMTGTKPGGEPWAFPSLDDLTPDVIEYWAMRAGQTPSLIMRLRYLNLVWDFSRLIAGTAAGVVVARSLIETTIDLVASGSIKYETSGIDKLDRALDVALSIRDKDAVARVRDATIAYHDVLATAGRPWSGFAFDMLIENKRRFRELCG